MLKDFLLADQDNLLIIYTLILPVLVQNMQKVNNQVFHIQAPPSLLIVEIGVNFITIHKPSEPKSKEKALPFRHSFFFSSKLVQNSKILYTFLQNLSGEDISPNFIILILFILRLNH